LDLIDLFIGSEGTLGIITAATLLVFPVRPAQCVVFAPFPRRSAAIEFVRQLRDAAQHTWTSRDGRGIDVAAIEHLDARSVALLRDDGADRVNGVPFPADTAVALLIVLELAPTTTSEMAFDEIGRALHPDAPDTPLVRLCRALDAAGVLEHVHVAAPGDHARAAQLFAIREAVPVAVNQRVGQAQQTIDGRIHKTAADMIVPFDRLEELLTIYDEGFRARGLDAAVWGHISDGNVHPNVLPKSAADVEAGQNAILEFGRAAIRLGGSPLAEHGVGRNPVKQRLLLELYGADGIEQMRRVKRALDPQSKLAPGVLFGARA
jgi:D-lactate dehydrogenase (cytochrome)